MDIGSAIIGVIFVLICAVPFVIMNRSKKKKEKLILQSLSEIANRVHCQIGPHEVSGNMAIGMDTSKNFVFFYKQTQEKVTEKIVDLAKIKSCKVNNMSRTIRNQQSSQRVIDSIDLSFVPSAKNEPEVKIEFFNAEEHAQLNGELQSAEKWMQIIKDQLNRKK